VDEDSQARAQLNLLIDRKVPGQNGIYIFPRAAKQPLLLTLDRNC
jgi:hypothetical protein